MWFRIGLITVIMSIAVASASGAEEVLFGFTIDDKVGNLANESSAYIAFGYTPQPAGDLFGEAPRSLADSGTTFTATTGSPNFSDFVSKITDGQNELLNLVLLSPTTLGGGDLQGLETDFIYRTPDVNDPHPDLQGDSISRVTMKINSFTAEAGTVDSNPFTNFDANVTVAVYGNGPAVGYVTDYTPEPSSVGIVAFPIAALLVRRKRPAGR